MIAEARKRGIQKIFELDGHVYAFDSTTIVRCLSVLERAKFRKHKGGIKMHTLYDWRLKLLHSCILPKQKSMIQRLCRRFRMRRARTISSTVATTISVIYTL